VKTDHPYYADSALYDAVHADVTADVPLFVALARAAGGPVLEVCCGNGRLLLPIAAAGVEIDGLDASHAMLAGLRERLATHGLAAGVHEGDMRTFALPRRYALVLIGFNSFLHNLTQADQLATLRTCRAHLADGGRVMLQMFHPAADKLIEWTADEKHVKDIPNVTGPGHVRVFDHAEDDRVEQVRRISRRIEFTDDAGRIVSTKPLEFTLRYVFKPEMELLLRVAGFAGWQVQPLDLRDDGGLVPADRVPIEGDGLLWTAW
jgi:SAM-dependent methyltransferase